MFYRVLRFFPLPTFGTIVAAGAFVFVQAGGGARLAAAELRLSNGDRLTGTVLERGEGKLHFRSALLGDFVVDESTVTLVEPPEASAPAEGEPTAEAQELAQAETGAEVEAAVASAEVAAPTEATVADATTAEPAAAAQESGVKLPPRVKWSGRFEVSLFSQSGRSDNKNSSLRIEADRVSRRNNYRFRSRYLYGSSNQRVSNDRFSSDLRWRRELSRRMFAQSQTSYLRDRLAAISFSMEQNLSLGYQMLKSSRHDLNFGAGGTVLYREAFGLDASALYLTEVFEDYSYKFNSRVTVRQGLNALYSPSGRATITDGEHFKLRFSSAVESKMTDRILLSLRYEYEYDNSIMLPSARRDERITSSIGYSF